MALRRVEEVEAGLLLRTVVVVEGEGEELRLLGSEGGQVEAEEEERRWSRA